MFLCGKNPQKNILNPWIYGIPHPHSILVIILNHKNCLTPNHTHGVNHKTGPDLHLEPHQVGLGPNTPWSNCAKLVQRAVFLNGVFHTRKHIKPQRAERRGTVQRSTERLVLPTGKCFSAAFAGLICLVWTNRSQVATCILTEKLPSLPESRR